MKLKELTEKQNDFYQMLIQFFDFYQRVPTLKEAAECMGSKNPNMAMEKFSALVAKGYMNKEVSRKVTRYTFTEYEAVLVKLTGKEV